MNPNNPLVQHWINRNFVEGLEYFKSLPSPTPDDYTYAGILQLGNPEENFLDIALQYLWQAKAGGEFVVGPEAHALTGKGLYKEAKDLLKTADLTSADDFDLKIFYRECARICHHSGEYANAYRYLELASHHSTHPASGIIDVSLTPIHIHCLADSGDDAGVFSASKAFIHSPQYSAKASNWALLFLAISAANINKLEEAKTALDALLGSEHDPIKKFYYLMGQIDTFPLMRRYSEVLQIAKQVRVTTHNFTDAMIYVDLSCAMANIGLGNHQDAASNLVSASSHKQVLNIDDLRIQLRNAQLKTHLDAPDPSWPMGLGKKLSNMGAHRDAATAFIHALDSALATDDPRLAETAYIHAVEEIRKCKTAVFAHEISLTKHLRHHIVYSSSQYPIMRDIVLKNEAGQEGAYIVPEQPLPVVANCPTKTLDNLQIVGHRFLGNNDGIQFNYYHDGFPANIVVRLKPQIDEPYLLEWQEQENCLVAVTYHPLDNSIVRLPLAGLSLEDITLSSSKSSI